MSELFNEIGLWLWLMAVSLIGGVLGFMNRNDLDGKDAGEKIRALVLGVTTSMFVAYLVYELSLFMLNKESLSVAIAGLAAYIGTNALVALESAFIDWIGKIKR